MNNKALFGKYVNKVNSLNDENFNTLNKEFFNGKNYILRFSKKGSSEFDPSWIDKIEECLFDLGEIVNKPREVTSEEGNVTPIELAKKVNGESVQHLASHTQYIKDISETGDVMPAKILSHFNKQELHTYENRFIATFVRRLVLFIEKRYEFIKSTVNLESNDILMIKNTSIINGQEVEIETKVKVKKEAQDDVTQTAKDYIERIELMRDYVAYYYNSPFMREMKNEKDVRKPIIQTNIIRKNPLYHKCFETFMFIERFESLGVSYKIDENYLQYSDEEREKLTYLLTSNYLALQDLDEYEVVKSNNKVYKPKIAMSIDDEEFSYGKLLEGPIEFVRVDEKYRQYLQSKIDPELPLHPTKAEKEYYSKEYALKREILNDLREIDKILARTERELEHWEKEVQRIMEHRDQEEIEEATRKLEELNAYHQALLEEKRQMIRDAAKLNASEMETIQKDYEYVELNKRIEKIEEKIARIYRVKNESKYEFKDGHMVQTLYAVKDEDEVEEETIVLPQVQEISQDAIEEINGKFIVKTPHGYYVSEGKYINIKSRAFVFDDFNEATRIKNLLEGKVIRL